MPGLKTFLALDHQSLADQLARDLAPGGSREGQGNARNPFLKDIIIVDGKALSNWLTHGLVVEGGMGIQMNAELMNTRRFGPWLASLLRPASCPNPKLDPLDGLAARIFRLLQPDLGFAKDWQDCLPQENTDVAQAEIVRWGLSFRLAQHFGDLLRNDPDWIRSAARAKDRWQKLWVKLMEEIRSDYPEAAPYHDAEVADLLAADPNALQSVAKHLPGRISLFSTGDIPRVVLDILVTLSAEIDARVYHLQPTESFHEDLRLAKGKQKAGKHADIGDDDYEKSYPSPGFPLLLSCGKFYRQQQRKLLDVPYAISADCPEPQYQATMLGELKRSINEFDQEGVTFGPVEDASISIHRCHGPRREVEVLRDELLKLFATDAKLKQGDILILSPEPELYAPMIEGVLGGMEAIFAHRRPGPGYRGQGFKVRTAGLLGAKNSPFGALVKLLAELPLGRVGADEIYELLGMTAIQAKLKWDVSRLGLARRWFENAPFYWGLNRAHRTFYLSQGDVIDAAVMESAKELTEVGTYDDFLRRVALGAAMGGKPRVASCPGLHDGGKTLPLDGVEGQEGLRFAHELLQVLGQVRLWLDFALRKPDEPQALSAWLDAFAELGGALLPRDKDYAKQYSEFRLALSRMRKQGELFAKLQQAPLLVSRHLFVKMLLDQCDFASGTGQFMTGDLTVTSLKSASIHPAKVIVMLGMNDGAFPHAQRSPGPEISDGDTRARAAVMAKESTSMHAFLLAVLAAEAKLIVTFDGYVGSTGKRSASALPVELLRHACRKINPAFRITVHGLEAYLPPAELEAEHQQREVRELATYDLQAKRLHDALPSELRTMAAGSRASVNPETLTIEEFIQFWKEPSRFALKAHSARVPYGDESLDADEPMEDGAFEKSAALRWLKQARREQVPDLQWSLAQLSGRFPSGGKGEEMFEQLKSESVEEHDAIKRYICEIAGTGDTLPKVMHGAKDRAFLPYLVPSEKPTKLIVQFFHKPDDQGMVRALALWARASREYPDLAEIYLVGFGSKPDTASATMLKVLKGADELRAGFANFGRSALHPTQPMFIKLLTKAVWERIPKSTTKAEDRYPSVQLDQKDVTGAHARLGSGAVELLIPEEFSMIDFCKQVDDMLVTDGLQYLPDKMVRKSLSAPSSVDSENESENE
jgi:exodeoxyribonuclease V gamma subunit